MLAAMAPLSLWIYRVLMWLLLPLMLPLIVLRDRLTGKRRPRFRERLARSLPAVAPGGIWIQAVSVGEVEVARRLLAELEGRPGAPPVLLSATTATGLELARRSLGDRLPVLACPLDLPGPVGRVLDQARPRLLVLVETELWPELIHQAGRRRIPIAVVNGRLSDDSYRRYRRVRRLLEPLLAPIERVLVRAETDGRRFAGLGVDQTKIRVPGNIKYDLEADSRELEWEEDMRAMAAGRPIVVAGSTMEGEEQILLEALDRLNAEGRPVFTVFAPRHPERFDAVARLLQERGIRVARRSRLNQPPESPEVFLIDTIGELARAYRLGVAAVIGGSLVPTGGHNPLEPAVWAVPVLSGPHLHNFREVYDEMVAAGGARVVADAAELAVALAAWLDEPAAAQAAGKAGLAVVVRNRGATQRTVDELLELMESG
jgi:3-deoxy-D-manno-octulosonic-acid transferase